MFILPLFVLFTTMVTVWAEVTVANCSEVLPLRCQGLRGKICYSPEKLCDGSPDCIDKEDEKNCEYSLASIAVGLLRAENPDDLTHQLYTHQLLTGIFARHDNHDFVRDEEFSGVDGELIKLFVSTFKLVRSSPCYFPFIDTELAGRLPATKFDEWLQYDTNCIPFLVYSLGCNGNGVGGCVEKHSSLQKFEDAYKEYLKRKEDNNYQETSFHFFRTAVQISDQDKDFAVSYLYTLFSYLPDFRSAKNYPDNAEHFIKYAKLLKKTNYLGCEE